MGFDINPGLVAPLAGAWIETRPPLEFGTIYHVAPLAGAWIETNGLTFTAPNWRVAPLAGERGLKPASRRSHCKL